MKTKIDINALLKDMKYANEEASLVLKPLNEDTWELYEKCSFAFSPGCRLGAIEPEFVLRTYDAILAIQPDTAIILRCCGFPADLADETESKELSLSQLNDIWQNLGNPTIITACETCAQLFRETLPQIKIVSLREFLDDPVTEQIAKMLLENNELSNEEKTENMIFLKEELTNYF